MDERRKDTRAKIQEIALELFSERGYEKTSLREIADRLGVTKAALYYHFKAKEAIITSLFEDFIEEVDQIITWAEQQPPTVETRRAVVLRYAPLLQANGARMMRFMYENQLAARELEVGARMQERLRVLSQLLTDVEAPLSSQIRTRIAIMALHAGTLATADLDATEDQRATAALEIALDLVSGKN